ncbi:MAG: FHIPEP family type III secretion protein, partial [Gammaproteobacteria bacterium]|nr:FHIPEP family type III secretion protein [Gammaproteobacteria bacterium]
HGRQTQDPEALTSAVRVALGRTIVQKISDGADELPVITLDPRLEQILQEALKGGAETAGIEPTLAERLQGQLSETARRQEVTGQPAILLVSPALRPWLARFLRFAVPNLRVLAYNEIPDSKRVRLIAAVGT